MSTIIIPQNIDQDKLKDLLERGQVVERDALEHLAETFEAAADTLRAVRRTEAIEDLEALVIMDPDEDALVLLWRKKDEGPVPDVS